MPPTPYTLNRILKRSTRGITKVSLCTMSAYLKFDCDESPYCVYNEQVACQLAQTLHVPTAIGVVTIMPDGQAFASLKVWSTGIDMPNLTHRAAIIEVAKRYPEEVAALVAFDVFIGNNDREQNVKACVVSDHIHLFLAIDHSHCLLTIDDRAELSLDRLKSGELIVRTHPFYGFVDTKLLVNWVNRIAKLDEQYIEECCLMGQPLKAVTKGLQKDLAKALLIRQKMLPQIIDKIKKDIDIKYACKITF